MPGVSEKKQDNSVVNGNVPNTRTAVPTQSRSDSNPNVGDTIQDLPANNWGKQSTSLTYQNQMTQSQTTVQDTKESALASTTSSRLDDLGRNDGNEDYDYDDNKDLGDWRDWGKDEESEGNYDNDFTGKGNDWGDDDDYFNDDEEEDDDGNEGLSSWNNPVQPGKSEPLDPK